MITIKCRSLMKEKIFPSISSVPSNFCPPSPVGHPIKGDQNFAQQLFHGVPPQIVHTLHLSGLCLFCRKWYHPILSFFQGGDQRWNVQNADMRILKMPGFAMDVAINWNLPARSVERWIHPAASFVMDAATTWHSPYNQFHMASLSMKN